jgi:hypothetical protein
LRKGLQEFITDFITGGTVRQASMTRPAHSVVLFASISV